MPDNDLAYYALSGQLWDHPVLAAFVPVQRERILRTLLATRVGIENIVAVLTAFGPSKIALAYAEDVQGDD